MDHARDPKTFTSRFELDYFRRARNLRRWKWALSLVAMLISGVVVATLVAAPRFHSAFQAAPVSHSHAGFGDNCAACHDQPFNTALRFFPGSTVGTVSDAKCTVCHDAGRHSPYQLHNTSPDGKASGCIDCHKEHRGDELSKLSDLACTNCHADLKTLDGSANVHAKIHHFADDHPPFGNWRKGGFTDPAGGKFKFNHKRHLELANELKDVSKESRPLLVAEAEKLRQLDCAYCHKPDADMKNMQPIRYDEHCGKCHPLTVTAMPVAHWPSEAAASFAQPLAHPGPGEGPAKIRAAILQRYLTIADKAKAANAAPNSEPKILGSVDEAKVIQESERVAMTRTRQSEAQLFVSKAGCALCHIETARSQDGLPEYAKPHQQLGRWNEVVSKWPATRFHEKVETMADARASFAYADAANRWHPLATFNHGVHRVYACTECHAARENSDTETVLIPQIDTCRKCHNRTATSARSDCLTCHHYHDRSQEAPTRKTTPDALKSLLQQAKP